MLSIPLSQWYYGGAIGWRGVGLSLPYTPTEQRLRGLGFMWNEPGWGGGQGGGYRGKAEFSVNQDVPFPSLLFDRRRRVTWQAAFADRGGTAADRCWNPNVSFLSSPLQPPPPPPSLLGSWPSSMKIFSLSQHMCQHQRPTTAWNSRGRFIEGDVGRCVPSFRQLWLTCLGFCSEQPSSGLLLAVAAFFFLFSFFSPPPVQ